MDSISIIIPAINEAKRLPSTLGKVDGFCRAHFPDYELIVVDDGSTDGTGDIVRRLTPHAKVLRNRRNMGKGYSVRRGIMHASKEFVLFSDSDLSTPLEELLKFSSYIRGCDVVIGSRNMQGSRIMIKQSFFRSFAGRIFPLLVRLLLLPRIRDTQCGFKLFRRACARKIFPLVSIDRFGFDIEVLFIARKQRCKIKELPVSWYNARGSTVRIFPDAFCMFTDILKVQLNELRGRYEREAGKKR